MNKNYKYLLIGFICSLSTLHIQAQESEQIIDSTQWVSLKDIVVIGNPRLQHIKQAKPLSSLDEYLESSEAMNMIKRGAYAWEPSMNGMSSERLSVTIDGMQIFGACTDKMDPITSYVDVSNLSEAHISSGQAGNEYGNTIAGGLDLKLKKNQFISRGLRGMVEAGYESNNSLKIGSASLDYSETDYYLSTDITYRDAENYTDGEGNEVLYSQFSKMNASVNAGYKLNNLNSIHATFIYDKATDVGYPALTMDVSSAEAFIASLSYKHKKIGQFQNWETKVYWNDIMHVMDDTTRPDVPIHMDMPGWSTTYGAYSKIDLPLPNHQLKFNLNGYLNKSLAEMTMYPADKTEKSMFMLTWPDVQTLNTALYISDDFRWAQWNMSANMRLANHSNKVLDDFGLNSLKIFYPSMSDQRNQFLMSFGLHTHRMFKNWHLRAGIGYGERAPSVSEGYGFYLFNSFDNYDYIGNPNLPKEKSLDGQIELSYEKPRWKVGIEANHFYIQDYIIGEITHQVAPMTIGASGIKVYNNLEYAKISNFKLSGSFEPYRNLALKVSTSYHIGESNEGESLPLISPFTFKLGVDFHNQGWFSSIDWQGAGKQSAYSAIYGEDSTPAYSLVNLSVGKSIKLDTNQLILKGGIQNLLDKQYSTYSDWRNIPRMGRNIYLNLSYLINN
ncbi:MAG: TonB-dependent receptor plug domain-containing protein [Weeksellaceae bacterium]